MKPAAFEYKILTGSRDDVAQLLNEHGLSGWLLGSSSIVVFNSSLIMTCVMLRQRREPADA